MKKLLVLFFSGFFVFAILSFLNASSLKSDINVYAQDEHPEPSPEPEHPIIVWDKNRPLTWDDFKGPIPEDREEGIDAETVSGVNSTFEVEVDCQPIGKSGKVKCTATAKDVKAQAEFDPNTSWVDPDKKTDALLKHEQGHFDISEHFARKKQEEMDKAAKAGVSKEGPAGEAADLAKKAADELHDKLEKICDDINAEEKKMQDEYDTETNHGKNDKEQDKWNKKIEKLLKK